MRGSTGPSSPAEEPLPGGLVPGSTVRVGGTVRRATGPWTEATQAVLAHLEAVGFDGSPRVVGFDEMGREILTFVEGRPGTVPLPKELSTDAGLASAAALLRQYHEAVKGYRPTAAEMWASGPRILQGDEIVLHGDPGPWNTIWRDGEAVAFVDWDLAEPGAPIVDVARACWLNVPLVDDEVAAGWGFDTALNRQRRLSVFCERYGVAKAAVLTALERDQLDGADRIERLAALGWTPWSDFASLGLPDRARDAAAWLSHHRGDLLGPEPDSSRD